VREQNSVALPDDETGASARLKLALEHMDEALQRSEASSERRSTAFAASVELHVIEIVNACDDE